KQANINILKTCSYLILFIVFFSFGYVFYDNYVSMKNVSNIQEKITQVIEINDSEEIMEDLNENKGEDDKLVVNEDIVSLIQENPQTIGWLKVNNTNIDYPVVQGADNQYYLKHNYYMEEDNNGWVFMDYRNDTELLSDNVIIYAHNRYHSGVMFGTLQNTLRYSWYSNPDNHTISFRTLYEDLEYQIFSIYKISVTTDYMRVLFADDNDRLDFYNMLKDRSIYDFGVTLSGDDKIITLSTCADEYNRYVVHAVLKNK
ncbi:MAG TPA: class B sortase, partial [Candidatus Onthocola stercoravium]|nr:class B sortase [Candidatus Onthocola stercoravium]